MIDKNAVKVVGRKVSEPVLPSAQFEAGTVLAVIDNGGKRATRPVYSTDAAGVVLGCAWNDKALIRKKALIDEAVVLISSDVTNLKKSLVQDVKVTNVAKTSTFTLSDYSVNATNGTIQRVPAGDIADGSTVLVSYVYQLSEVELITEGTNVHGNLDDTAATGEITVLRDYTIVPTNVFDTKEAYAIGDALKVKTGGIFNKTTGPLFGKVYAAPTAAYPFLTVEYPAN
jgi:hypothetical protein